MEPSSSCKQDVRRPHGRTTAGISFDLSSQSTTSVHPLGRTFGKLALSGAVLFIGRRRIGESPLGPSMPFGDFHRLSLMWMASESGNLSLDRSQQLFWRPRVYRSGPPITMYLIARRVKPGHGQLNVKWCSEIKTDTSGKGNDSIEERGFLALSKCVGYLIQSICLTENRYVYVKLTVSLISIVPASEIITSH